MKKRTIGKLFLKLIFMSLLLFYLIELKEEVFPVSNLKPNVIQENILQGGPFRIAFFFKLTILAVRNYPYLTDKVSRR